MQVADDPAVRGDEHLFRRRAAGLDLAAAVEAEAVVANDVEERPGGKRGDVAGDRLGYRIADRG